MNPLHHHRTQLPVGEGFFHAGCVGTDGVEKTHLSYVYDCGAQSAYQAERNTQIDDYANARTFRCSKGSQNLDLLFLSHAHLDHVNGVERLMGYISIGTVVMPLIEPRQRLMAFAHATLHEEFKQDDAAVLTFYEDFTVSPAETVLELGAGRVIEVVPGVPVPEQGTEDPIQDVPVEDLPTVDLPLTGDDTAPQSWRLVGTGVVETTSRDGGTVLRMPDTVHFRATAAPTTFPWDLATHVDPPVARRAAQFENKLMSQLNLTSQDLNDWFQNPDRMRDLVTTHRKKLVASYLHASQRRDLNITSLSLYSGPDRARPSHTAPKLAVISWRRGDMDSLCTGDDDLRVGWLGTGDAALKQEVRRTPFLAHFKPYADLIHTMTLPHHGSAHSYHAELVEKLAPKLCVAPAAPYRNWQHPGHSVVTSALQHALVIPVSNKRDSRLNEEVHVTFH